MTMVAILVCANFTSCSDDDDDSTFDGGSKIPTNTIYYETTDKIELRLKNEDVFGGAELKNNTYSTTNGYGILEFDSEVTAIESGAFKNEKTLSSITLPNSVVTIEDFAFGYCSNLESAILGNRVEKIGDHAFYCCRGLTSITIPNSVTTIGDYAFEDCSGLESITIPNSVTTIGRSAFYNCNLTSVTIGDGVTTIGRYAFGGCYFESIYVKSKTPAELWLSFNDYTLQNATLYVPKGSLDTYKNAYEWQEFENIKEF